MQAQSGDSIEQKYAALQAKTVLLMGKFKEVNAEKERLQAVVAQHSAASSGSSANEVRWTRQEEEAKVFDGGVPLFLLLGFSFSFFFFL
jgi:hypothetical protein